MNQQLDILTLGRCSLDLFSEQIGADFVDIKSFTTMVGGSPTNIAIGTHRLGLHSAAVTAVGADVVGDFVRNYLSKEGVTTDYVLTKAGSTALAILGVKPPSEFPLTFYRDDPPDQYISVEDMKTLPLDSVPLALVAGSNFAYLHLRDATLFLAKHGRKQGATIAIDLDLRTSLWQYPDAYTQNMQTVLPHCHIIIGTEEEMWGALSDEPGLVWNGRSLPSEKIPVLDTLITQSLGAEQTIVLKRGPKGATIFRNGRSPLDVAGFPVEVLNTVGAGDSFASGLLYGRRQGWDWQKATRFANACGAIVVTRHGCSTALPTLPEVKTFAQARGGF
ncbi:MAG: 5-dehydro-2-deoxygluconokinase [Anaerolineales bacterium]|nr:5-dehydro-2-deoxygluconokinase [Anaerolineales bacterium]